MDDLHKAAAGDAAMDKVRLMGVQDSPFAAAVDAAEPSYFAAVALPEAEGFGPEGFGPECFGPEVPDPDALVGDFAHEGFATAVRSEPAEVEQLGPAFVAVTAAVVSRICAAAIFARNGGTCGNPRAAVAPVGWSSHYPGASPRRRAPAYSSSPGTKRTHFSSCYERKSLH